LGGAVGNGVRPTRPAAVLLAEPVLPEQGLLVVGLPGLVLDRALLAELRRRGQQLALLEDVHHPDDAERLFYQVAPAHAPSSFLRAEMAAPTSPRRGSCLFS